MADIDIDGIHFLQLKALEWIHDNKLEGEYNLFMIRKGCFDFGLPHIPYTLLDFVINYSITRASGKEGQDAKNDTGNSRTKSATSDGA